MVYSGMDYHSWCAGWQVAGMQADNVYRPTEDTTGRHRQLLTALADAALLRAKGIMQRPSEHGQFCLHPHLTDSCRSCTKGMPCKV